MRMTQYPQTSWCGRCFTYPQGAVSFLPQVIAVAAVYGCIAAFSTWQPLEDNWIKHAPSFICLLVKARLEGSGGSGGRSLQSTSPGFDYEEEDDGWIYGHECFSLTFHDDYYWDVEKDDIKWAWAIRLACLILMFTTIAGGMATVVLLSATCFRLPPRTISKIGVVFFVCAPMSLLTLIAGATSLCRRNFPEDDFPDIECKRNGTGVRLDYGATTMIFVAILYLLAGIATISYRTAVIEGNTGEEEDGDSTVESSDDHIHKRSETVPLMHLPGGAQQPVARTTIKHTPEGTVTTKETKNADGPKTVEIIEDDTMSPPSSPSGRKSPRRTKNRNTKRESAGISAPLPLDKEQSM